jgi:hypothetical protein
MKHIVVFSILQALILGVYGQESQMAPRDGVRLEVVSVRPLSEEEALKRSPGDVSGLDVVVRLRLSCSTNGVYILTTSNPLHLMPEGHAVKITKRGLVWRYGTLTGGEAAFSPGSRRVCGDLPCEWVRLPAHSALEWEKLDVSAASDEVRAFTVFIKGSSQGGEREIVSTSFNAPLTTSPVKPKR